MMTFILKSIALLVKLAPVLASLLAQLSNASAKVIGQKKGRTQTQSDAGDAFRKLLQAAHAAKWEQNARKESDPQSHQSSADGADGALSERLRYTDGFKRD
nr:hypothetical protein [uncultured Cohaesibacter sp.]